MLVNNIQHLVLCYDNIKRLKNGFTNSASKIYEAESEACQVVNVAKIFIFCIEASPNFLNHHVNKKSNRIYNMYKKNLREE